jgi:hypothetical protein
MKGLAIGTIYDSSIQYNPEIFYSEVEDILKEREIPDFEITRKTFSEGGYLAHNRLYLEIKRKDYVFHICAAPWGTDFFSPGG